MLRSLRIKNFQCYEDTELIFSSGVNAIVPESEDNPNDIGKTTIKRALQLLCTNRPAGGSYFPKNMSMGKTEISIKLDDCDDISLIKTIEKGTVKNAVYNLGRKTFKKFGALIPDQILSGLNISEINFQDQLDSPYLITSTPGEIARTINKITKIEKSDQWILALTSEINVTNKKIEKFKNDISDKKNELKVYADIDETKFLINRYEKIEIKIRRYTDDYDNLVSIDVENVKLEGWIDENKKIVVDVEMCFYEFGFVLKEIEKHQEEVEKLQYFLFLSSEVEKLAKSNVDQDMILLERLLQDENEKRKEKSNLQDFLFLSSEVEKLARSNVDKELMSIREVLCLIDDVQKEKDILLDLVDLQKKIGSLADEYSDMKEKYIFGLRKFGKCPTCLSIVGEKTMKRIAKEL